MCLPQSKLQEIDESHDTVTDLVKSDLDTNSNLINTLESVNCKVTVASDGDQEIEEVNKHNDWVALEMYAPEFMNTELDFPDENINQDFFSWFTADWKQQGFIQDIMLANKITNSSMPNRFGCRIPVRSVWNIELLDTLLINNHDHKLLEWLCFGFSISRDETAPDPKPADCNHKGATLYPEVIDEYVETEVGFGASMGPFTIPPSWAEFGSLCCQQGQRGTQIKGGL